MKYTLKLVNYKIDLIEQIDDLIKLPQSPFKCLKNVTMFNSLLAYEISRHLTLFSQAKMIFNENIYVSFLVPP